ncbi:hypothetical protein BTUL_0059g00230 [Botrytis tulipae]|uniref:ABC transmembrane type-1 domain-containing protein n=1 Tax=Botrytis tulipae TaxID=87230 RepID=A0A4Z1ESM7_9HELO|nr:hypothetical protein BTUL_0059g00230 [Botrytis tulipae]
MFVAASALKLVAALCMLPLSVIDHSRSPRPSVVLNSYLFFTLLLDAAQARTLFLSSDKSGLVYSSVFITALALKCIILLLESRQKYKSVNWNQKEHSPEETSGIFSLGVFFWLNKMFLMGYNKVLAIEDLYPLDSSFDAKSLHDGFSKNMDYSKLKGDKFALLKVLIHTLKVPLLLPIPLRLALIAFTFCQPLFIERLLDTLAQPEIDANVGYGFIGAKTYINVTKARIGAGDDSAALTLMSTDIERIKMGMRNLHEVWASIVQAAIAGWMLYSRLGLVFIAPMGLVMVCFFGLAILMNFAGDSQRTWMSGVQKRVGLMATVIASMKNLKISGLSRTVSDFVQKLRVEELAAGARFRKIFIIAALFGFIPLLIDPPLTFAYTSKTLDASKVFTSLSFLTLLTVPLSDIFQSTPELISGIACLGRIQAFLEKLDAEKTRTDTVASLDSELDLKPPIVIQNGKFGWEEDNFVLRDVNAKVSKSSLTIVVGPIGSGKSTLCKALLGEIPFSEGNVSLSTRFPHVGFYEQATFLYNGTVRENIIGFSPFDSERYAEVTNATSPVFDLATLPLGDQTNIGSDGIILSGGQKQRVSLARALYLQSELLVLDDVFSGLDADTEEKVFQQVFGANGLLRKRRCTVVLCTHSVRHLPAADYIITLGEGTIVEQGSFNELMRKQGYVQRLGLKSSSDSEVLSEDITPKESVRRSEPHVLETTKTAETLSLAPEADKSRQMGDGTVYKHYFLSMGWFSAVCRLISRITGLDYWTDNTFSKSHAYYAGIYALLQISGLFSLLLLGITLFIVSVKRAGAKLHHDALRTLIRAPLRFFTKTDTGVVTNLFSQDLNLIDTELPDATLNTLFCVFQAIGQMAVMLTSSAYLAISYPLLGALLYVVQRFYLRTSRQLRLLDLEAKSPLYTHFLDTLRGIATLRAFGFVSDDVQKNARLINASQRPAYFLLMIQEWLNLVLDLVVMAMAVVVTTLAVRLHSDSGFAGASLYTHISFGENLSGIVTYYTKLETSIGAIARLKMLNENVKPEEKDEENIVPPEQWPHSGVVELKGISAGYDVEDTSDSTPSLALRDINLTIASGEKIAICGRTGSGKSSLIALLLKLLDPTHETAANAIIDNIPLRNINREALRQRIIAVPQEAVFLPDGTTFQTNLDPSHISTPAECRAVLETVDLWSFVQQREREGSVGVWLDFWVGVVICID